MARGSLGPFPKTKRLREIVGEEADMFIGQVRERVAGDMKSPIALSALEVLTSLVIGTRISDVVAIRSRHLKFESPGPVGEYVKGLQSEHPHEPSLIAMGELFAEVNKGVVAGALCGKEPWADWRAYDGPTYCDLARNYYSRYLRASLREELRRSGTRANGEDVARFASEASVITRPFSARWYNACALADIPEQGSVRWYLGHCLGKLDLELERELSTWVEPKGNPWSRPKPPSPQLALDLF